MFDMNAPMKPSIVLLGLRPINLCRPNIIPVKYAAASFSTMETNGYIYHHLLAVIDVHECREDEVQVRVATIIEYAILLSWYLTVLGLKLETVHTKRVLTRIITMGP